MAGAEGIARRRPVEAIDVGGTPEGGGRSANAKLPPAKSASPVSSPSSCAGAAGRATVFAISGRRREVVAKAAFDTSGGGSRARRWRKRGISSRVWPTITCTGGAGDRGHQFVAEQFMSATGVNGGTALANCAVAMVSLICAARMSGAGTRSHWSGLAMPSRSCSLRRCPQRRAAQHAKLRDHAAVGAFGTPSMASTEAPWTGRRS
jgi:hypothetical protein